MNDEQQKPDPEITEPVNEEKTSAENLDDVDLPEGAQNKTADAEDKPADDFEEMATQQFSMDDLKKQHEANEEAPADDESAEPADIATDGDNQTAEPVAETPEEKPLLTDEPVVEKEAAITDTEEVSEEDSTDGAVEPEATPVVADDGKRRIKIGIDVGGTFTHAVAVDLATMDLAGKAVVPTTHKAAEGVALGVVQSMKKLLDATGIQPDEVILIAHSTTQATNALIEGDVARVGIVGMASGAKAVRAKSEANLGKIELSPGKYLETSFRFIDTEKEYNDETIHRVIKELKEEGCQVIVSSESFGVDDPTREQHVADLSIADGTYACSSSALSQLYGLRVRTRTAVVNASMLPKMLETANMTEKAVRESGIDAPLMVMRSDGGIMDIEEMRKRPILTMLSGPAAGVAAALMYERISDGCMVEVGGTTSDICVIKNGRPIVTHGEIGGHRLYIKTLDVRTVGIAGGSVPRVSRGKVSEVGPRSAHIANLGYEAFTEDISSVEPLTIQPIKGDPSDYLALKINGEETPSITLTPTGAANVLGLASGYGAGSKASVNKAFEAVAKWLKSSPEAIAERIQELCSAKVMPIVKAMIEEHKLKGRAISFVGGGGGAEAIVPYAAQKLGLEHRIAKNNEVISAVGVALGIIQDTVERTIMNPSDNDIIQLRREAFESVQKMGADADSIEVVIEIDRQTKTVSATASGTPELRTRTLGGDLPSDDELLGIAAKTTNCESDQIKAVNDEGWMCVFEGERPRKIFFGLFEMIDSPVVVIDREGIVRLQVPDARVDYTPSSNLDDVMRTILDQFTTYGDAGMVPPDIYLVKAGQIIDLTGLVEGDQMLSVARVETQSLLPEEKLAVISSRKG
jgi:N-methylhydantoinase A/oxoprolinase/acetone carboxylase beta subunit